jgi:hypothetical protein
MDFRFRGAVVLGSDTLTKTTTIDTLADVATVPCDVLVTKHLTFKAVTNTLVAKVLGSQDGGLTFPTQVEAEFDVTTAAQVLKTVTAFYTHLKVQVKPKVAATHGTLTVYVKGASF